MLLPSHRGGLWVVWPLKRGDPRSPENHTALQQKDTDRSKPQKSLLLGEEEGSAWSLMAQREKAAGLESANLEAAVPLKAAWIPAHLWYLSHSFISHNKSPGCAAATFAHRSSLSSVWSGIGTWGTLRVNVTFRGCVRNPDNEKSRDWPWEGRGEKGDGQVDLRRHRPEREKNRKKQG